jgi:hypothetical protein
MEARRGKGMEQWLDIRARTARALNCNWPMQSPEFYCISHSDRDCASSSDRIDNARRDIISEMTRSGSEVKDNRSYSQRRSDLEELVQIETHVTEYVRNLRDSHFPKSREMEF